MATGPVVEEVGDATSKIWSSFWSCNLGARAGRVPCYVQICVLTVRYVRGYDQREQGP